MEKYGFVYIWYDKKRKMYYIGCHWGTEDDGYICSSNRMRNAYKRRPEDFRRRIIKRIYTNKKEMFTEEYNYLKLIDKKNLGKKYYNLNNKQMNHWSSSSNDIYENTIHKLKKRKHTEETKNKLRLANKKQFEDSEKRQKHLNSFLEKNGNHRGTIWINNGIISKRVDHEDLISYIEKGNWIKGRMKKDVNFWKHSNRKRDFITGRFTKK